jgi:Flp pilus assembly protein TadB
LLALGLLGALSPAAVLPLVTTAPGRILIVMSALLDLAAIVLLRRIARGVER